MSIPASQNSVFAVETASGRFVDLSAPDPTDEERAQIAGGANVELTVWGGQPPVAMRVVDTPLGRPSSPREASSS